MSPRRPEARVAAASVGQGEPRAETDPLAPWLQRAAAGDERATTELLAAVAPAVLGLVRVVLGSRSPDVDDIAQVALLAIHDAIPRFRGDSSFLRYARRIAVRTAVAARRRRPSVELEALTHEPAGPGPTSDDGLARERRLGVLRTLLDELPDGQAESLAMRAVLGCSLGEVADATGVPVNTVRSRIRLAKEHLKDRICRDRVLASLFEVDRCEDR
jgi:RNA polymerase sigma-70 factor (ECF subfamily)